MNTIYKLLFIPSFLLLGGCGSSQTEDAHSHGDEEIAISHTIWTDKTELFVEFHPLVVGELCTFAAHFTEMNNFKAITEGTVTVSLISGSKGIRSSVDEPASPGIFNPAIQPTTAGVFNLVFEIETPVLTDRITIEGVEVYPSEEVAHESVPHGEDDPNEIIFLKEQAWKMDFANEEVKRDTIYEVIKTGGEILPAQGDEQTISATANGMVVYNSALSAVGAKVSKGQSLFSISGDNVSHDNVKTDFQQAKSKYTIAKSTFERKKELFETQLVSKSELEAAQLEFELAESEYQNLSRNFSKSGKNIKSSSNGFIKNFMVSEGAYVQIGDPLAVITQNKRLTIKADISQLYYDKLSSSVSANFSFNGTMYSIADFNGKLLSYGKSVSHDHPKIPVYFEIDNTGELLAGSYIEVWVKMNPKATALQLPEAALLENFGTYSVMVQTGGETFEQRDVEIGVSDGKYVEILSGVVAGERVVTNGAYQIKMASMSGTLPDHGHSH
jgi:RND family efflux transporter MFP subunit